ncbi:MAG: aspartate dehydrogenase [Nitrososphaerales archaeon]
MSKKVRIGLIGCGAIGSEIAKAIDEGLVPNAELKAALDKNLQALHTLNTHLKKRYKPVKTLAELLKTNIDLIVEAASQQAVREYSEKILKSRKDLVVLSVGALLDRELLQRLLLLCQRYGCKIYVVSGALGGIDAVKAASIVGFSELSLTTRKHPRALASSPFFAEKGIDPSSITEPTTLYEGGAVEAARLFPANVNVGATLTLAASPNREPTIRVIADPTLDVNIHEVVAKGKFGEISIVLKNKPFPNNPKTSYIAALSAISTLRSICTLGLKVGT